MVCVLLASTLALIDAGYLPVSEINTETTGQQLAELRADYQRLSEKIAKLEEAKQQRDVDIAELKAEVETLREECGCESSQAGNSTTDTNFWLPYLKTFDLIHFVHYRYWDLTRISVNSMQVSI